MVPDINTWLQTNHPGNGATIDMKINGNRIEIHNYLKTLST